jgi:hypothetical protein
MNHIDHALHPSKEELEVKALRTMYHLPSSDLVGILSASANLLLWAVAWQHALFHIHLSGPSSSSNLHIFVVFAAIEFL